MASAIGAALISTILPPLADLAMEKVKAMVVDKGDGIVNIERDISNLQITLRMIESIVRVAEQKQIEDDFIRNWLRDLVDIAYKARDVLDDFITFSSCTITAEEAKKPVNTISSCMQSFFCCLSGDTSKLPLPKSVVNTYSSITASNPVNFFSSLKLSCLCGSSSDTSNISLPKLNRLEKDIRSVNERFDEKIKKSEIYATLKSVVEDEKKKEGSESVKNRRPEVGPYLNQQDNLFLGREEVKEGIMEKILHPSDDRVLVVVIWGMGGIGKTTLAQFIYNDERVKEQDYPTENRKWLCVGESKFCAKEIITNIICDSSTNDVESLQKKLVKKFRGKRFLIVLDDVWDVDGSEWDLLFNPLTEVGKGGLIIITRRERQLCDEIISQTAYNLRPLSEEDSWSIFESCAYVNGKADSTSELKSIGKEIVKKLNCHPLALKVVGRSLLNKDSSTWTDFLESKFPKDDEVMSALRWSYNHLPPHLKMCFTYCALFPKDRVLHKKVLVEMWMTHDLIQKEEQNRPEDVGARYFEQLVNASLLQCVDGKHVMHDLIHDLALHVSNGEFATDQMESLTNDQMETVRHVTITRGEYSKVPRLCKMEKLLTLYTIWSYEYYRKDSVLDVFNQLKSIRVLVLVSLEIIDIPDCISELRHLRYLDVRETKVKSLPDSLCHLYHLQMLAVPISALALPIDIVNISSLRYIRAELATCKGVGNLTSLQELSSIHVCKGDNIRELGYMQILRGEFTIRGLGNVEKLEDDVGALMDKQTLIDGLVLEFYKELEKSTISDEVLDALGCPPNLTYLRIAGYNGLKLPSWMVSVLPVVKNRTSIMNAANFMTYLSRLEICDCNGLKRLQLDAFVSLKELKISTCSSLVQITSAICESLEILYCRLLEKMDVARCDSLVVIKILKLEVKDCESLRSLSIDIHGLDSLEHLHINGCPKLELEFEDGSSSSSSGNSVAVPLHNITTDNTQVFRTLLHHKLVSLEYLGITNLGGFENFDETEANNFCKSRLLKSLRILQCKDLKSLPVDFHKLSSLEKLYISGCPQLQSLPPDFHKLSSLKQLSIIDCSQLQSLPADGLPLSLTFLCIMRCPLLYERCKDEPGLDWHKINHIPKTMIRQHW